MGQGSGQRTPDDRAIPWLQTRLASDDTGRCGWSMDGDGLFGALPGIDVAAPVAAHGPSFVRGAQTVRERPSAGLCRSRSPPRGLLPTSLVPSNPLTRTASDGPEGRWWG